MKRLITFKVVVLSFVLFLLQKDIRGQMGIGIPVPHASAGLEISASNKGLKIPHVSLAGPTDGAAVPFGAPAGLWVYNTNAAMAGGGGVGFYYNANEGNPGARNWVKMQTGLSSTATWNFTGNAGISSVSHFIGTTDDQPLVFAYGDINPLNIRKVGFLIPKEYSYYFNRIASKLDATAHFCIGIGTQSVSGNNTDNGRIGIGTRANNDIFNLNRGGFSVAIGDSALANFKRGTGAVLVGKNAGKLAEFATENTGIGYEVLKNTVAEANTAFGAMALQAVVGQYVDFGVGTEGFFNSAFGYKALQTSSDLQGNTALGANTGGVGYGNPIFQLNTVLGSGALEGITPSGQLVSMGTNIAVGYHSLRKGRTPNNNTAVGVQAMLDCISCSNNVAVGYLALTASSTGVQNVGIGSSASAALTSGALNTSAGTGSLGGVTNGSFNTAIGFLAYPVGNYSNSTVIGYFRNATADNQVRFGNTAVTSIGGQVAWTALSDERAKSEIWDDVPGIELISHLKPVTYKIDRNWVERQEHMYELRTSLHLPALQADETIHTGLEAQKLLKAISASGFESNIVDKPESEEGVYGIRYALMVVPLVKTIHQQQTMIKKLETQIAESEKLLNQLKSF